VYSIRVDFVKLPPQVNHNH